MRLQLKCRDDAGVIYADGFHVHTGACFGVAVAGIVSAAWFVKCGGYFGEIIRTWPDGKITLAQWGMAIALVVGLGFVGCVLWSFVSALIWAFHYHEWHLAAQRAELRIKVPFRQVRGELFVPAGVACVHVVDKPWRNRAVPYCQVWLEAKDGSRRLLDHGREAMELKTFAADIAAALCVPLVSPDGASPAAGGE